MVIRPYSKVRTEYGEARAERKSRRKVEHSVMGGGGGCENCGGCEFHNLKRFGWRGAAVKVAFSHSPFLRTPFTLQTIAHAHGGYSLQIRIFLWRWFRAAESGINCAGRRGSNKEAKEA